MTGAINMETCSIVLGKSAATDVFGLSMLLDGEDILQTVEAEIPAVFRLRNGDRYPPIADLGAYLQAGSIIGFLQNSILLMPIRMPCDGWLLASVAEGSRVEHASPVFRILRLTGAITP